MSDETPTKPAWIRHKPGCGQRVFNDPIDIHQHIEYCPQLLKRRISNLETALEKLTKVEIPAAPSVDIDEVGEWVEPEPAQEDELDPIGSVSGYVPQEDPNWDDEDEEPSTVQALR